MCVAWIDGTTGPFELSAKGTSDSIPNEVYVIQFFSNPNGTRQGKTLLGQTTVTTDAAGNAS
jgi:hypothetical protein